MVLQPTVSRDGVVKCNLIPITHHDAPVDFVPITLLISLDWDNINDTKKTKDFQAGSHRLYNQQLEERSRGGEVMASLLFTQICIHSSCYSNCKLYGKCVLKQNSWPTFCRNWENHREILLKTYCLWVKLACNHIDHRDRKSSVLPFKYFFMAWKQARGFCQCCFYRRLEEIVLYTLSNCTKLNFVGSR